MTKTTPLSFLDFFKSTPDHRLDRKKLHPVEEILLLSFTALIAGCDSWEDIELFGKTKLNELRAYLPYENGAASDDTIRRFFRNLDPADFESRFVEWVKSFQLELEKKVVAVDGKTSRRTFDTDSKPIHTVSAFACELGVTLGQVKTDVKSNEITAIPELLQMLDITGAIVTIDAMGCQHKIAKTIVEKNADYILALKGNQGTLNSDVITFFEHPPQNTNFDITEDYDKGHGRLETRKCIVTDDIDWLKELHPHWVNLNSIIEISRTRELKDSTSFEKHYYISSLSPDSGLILKSIRQHWCIENQLHWVLDVTFNDDHSRIRKGNAPQNMMILRNIALNLMRSLKQNNKYKRISLKRMRKLAGWNNDFLGEILNAKF